MWDTGTQSYTQSGTSFTEVMEREGLSEDEISGCSFALFTAIGGVGGWGAWSEASTTQRTCVLMILADKLLRDNWRLMSVPEYWNSAYGSVLFTRTNYTTPTVAVSTVPAPASAQVEHKAVFWGGYYFSSFKAAAENEGVSATDMEDYNPHDNHWSNLGILEQKYLLELLLSTLAKDNWTLITALSDTYFFTRPVQTS